MQQSKAIEAAKERGGDNAAGVVPLGSLGAVTLPSGVDGNLDVIIEPSGGEVGDEWTALGQDWDLVSRVKQLGPKSSHHLQVQLTEQLGDILYHIGRHEKQLQHKPDRQVRPHSLVIHSTLFTHYSLLTHYSLIDHYWCSRNCCSWLAEGSDKRPLLQIGWPRLQTSLSAKAGKRCA